VVLIRMKEQVREDDFHYKIPRQKGPCIKCGAFKGVRFDRHHITYEPPKRALLCESCHRRITAFNTKVTRRRGYVALSSIERQFLFTWWMDDKVVRRKIITKDVQQLIEDMKKM